MSAEEAWQAWNDESRWGQCNDSMQAAFMAGYRRALEDAADALDSDAAVLSGVDDYFRGYRDGLQGAGITLRNRSAAADSRETKD